MKSTLTASKLAYLQAMDIPLWVRRGSNEKPANLKEAEEGWAELQRCVKNCTRCGLHQGRTHAVFGMGRPESRLLFVGEGPGANEDRQGLPFVGRAGQLLDAMLNAIDLNREKAYIANIVKCRPPNNRDPQPEEIAACTPYLQQQIEYIQPKLIVALGRVAAHYLLQTKSSMAQLRGKVHSLPSKKVPLIVTFHPAYLLRNPLDKAQALQDLYLIKQYF